MIRCALFLSLVFLLLAATAEAQTRYVSDELVITFRTGPSAQNAIRRNLTSGDRVEVLEQQGDWAHVRLANGDDGWVLSRYLQAEPTAALELAAATRDLANARSRVEELEQTTESLTTELQSTRAELEQLRAASAGLEADLADIQSVSANALSLRDENEELRRRVSQLTTEANVAELEITELRSRERQNWFIIGAAVLFGGVVIGLIAPSLRPRRRSSW